MVPSADMRIPTSSSWASIYIKRKVNVVVELEREKTYLLKSLPLGIENWPSTIISDTYIPETADHAMLRLRQKGDHYEITKKTPVDGNDSSRQNEHTIVLRDSEFYAIKNCSNKSFEKRRYYGKIDGYDAEVDVYLSTLEGLVVVDFEFNSDEALDSFAMPGICLADVTQDELIAGGKLAGKTYNDIAAGLAKYNYKPLYVGREA